MNQKLIYNTQWFRVVKYWSRANMYIIYRNDDSVCEGVYWDLQRAITVCDGLEDKEQDKIKIAEDLFAELEECTNLDLAIQIHRELRNYY